MRVSKIQIQNIQIRKAKSEFRNPQSVGQASRLSPSLRSCNQPAKWLRPQRNSSLRRKNRVGDRRDARPTAWTQAVWAAIFSFAGLTCNAAANAEGENEILKLSPPHAELPPAFWEQYGPWVVVAAILLLALAVVAVWWCLRPKPSIPVPIEILTRRELEALRQRNEDGQVLSQISRVLRRYVVGAFALPPDELTTSEFCRVIDTHENIAPELAARVADFLRQCDELKFAPAGSPTPIGAAARALELVELGESRRAHLRKVASEVAEPLVKRT
jgi:hypothetical protein